MSLSSTIKKLGPGLLYAGAAIGVSHLVQSTRAGASFGIAMIIVVVLANFFKFPFFQYGPRYVAATGKSLLHGYNKMGRWAVWVFFLLTIGTMFIIQAAVTVVTGGLAGYLTGIDLPATVWTAILLGLCMFILLGGHYHLLDKFMKVVMLVLSVSTVVAAISSFFADVPKVTPAVPFDFANKEHLFFLIAFIGWMPAPIDISVWHSVWSVAKNRESKTRTTMKDALFDFNTGYWGTAFLALCFVALGAFMLYRSGVALSPNAVEFAGQIVEAYTRSLGSWSGPIIATAAFTTMLSTTITVMDGITRVMVPTTQLMAGKPDDNGSNRLYTVWNLVLVTGTLLIVLFFMKNMRSLVDIATTMSFLTAPVLAWLNMRVIERDDEVPGSARPDRFTRIVSRMGLLLLSAFAVYYLLLKMAVF